MDYGISFQWLSLNSAATAATFTGNPENDDHSNYFQAIHNFPHHQFLPLPTTSPFWSLLGL